MFRRWFLDHPSSVGESYFEHQWIALGFSAALFAAAAVCLFHALIPHLFQHTGSRMVAKLHDRMTTYRLAQKPHPAAPREAKDLPSRLSSSDA